MSQNIVRRLAAEFLGTATLLCTVVGSGIMAERLAGGNVAVALLANTIAIGLALFALILMFAMVSGAHFNPVVSMSAAIDGAVSWRDFSFYVPVQILGGLFGVAIANLMFDVPVFFPATQMRTGIGQWLGEFVATFGLIGVIITVSRKQKVFAVASAVAAYITAACWFPSSTSFANPAVTLARSFTDTFTGIRLSDAPEFIGTQILGAAFAALVFNWLAPKKVMSDKKRVLILCTGNSARSQMAEGILRHIAADRFEVESAGVAPSQLRPEAIKAMAEIGVDISGHRSKSVDEFEGQNFDFVITVCDNANETCPIFPGSTVRVHHNFEDPPAVGTADNETTMRIFRRVRDAIRKYLDEFVLTQS